MNARVESFLYLFHCWLTVLSQNRSYWSKRRSKRKKEMYIFLYTIKLLSIKGAGIYTHISSVRGLIISNLFRKHYFTINTGHCIYETFCKRFFFVVVVVFASARTTESNSVSKKKVFVILLLMNIASFYSY